VKSSEEHNGSQTRLQGAWLVTARVAWVAITLLTVGLFVAALPYFFASLHVVSTSSYGPQLTPGDVQELHRLGLSLDFYAWLNVSVYTIFLLVYVLVGVMIFLHKSDDRMALLASLTLVLFPVGLNSQIVGTLPPAWTLPTEFVQFFGDVSFALFFYLFPSGRFVPRWTRWLAILWVAVWANSVFFPNSAYNNTWFAAIPFFGLIAFAIILQIYRYRHVSTSLQRQQTKWVVFGITLAFGSYLFGFVLIYLVLPKFFPMGPLAYTLVQIPFVFLLLAYPLSIGFAILRARLWDIDILINRTLVYTSLTALLALLYFGLIFAFQSLFQGIFHQNNAVAIVVSTLVIYALFQPLRHRIQAIIDRRFYRRKYDAAKTLEAFSATLRNEVDLGQLREQLLTVVQETMQPAHVSLWLRKPQQVEKHNPWVPNPPSSQ
jgi:hypothetical protein